MSIVCALYTTCAVFLNRSLSPPVWIRTPLGLEIELTIGCFAALVVVGGSKDQLHGV